MSRFHGGFRAVTLMAVVLSVFGAFVVSSANVRQTAAQETLTAAIVAGSCQEPDSVAAELRPVVEAEGGALTSFTTIDLGIDDLTGGDYAILLGEDVDPVACGDIVGEGGDVYVAIPATTGSSLSGIAWLHARENRTQMSLFVGEGLSAGTAVTPSSNPTEEPTDNPQPPEVETPEPEQPSETSATYTSPSYGYTVTYDTAYWETIDERSEPGTYGAEDYLALSARDGTASAEFGGNALDPNATADVFIETVTESFVNDAQYTDVAIREDEDGNPIQGSEDGRSWVAIDFSREVEGEGHFDLTLYFVCWDLGEPGQLLTMVFQTSQAGYESRSVERERLVDSITFAE